MGIRFLDSFDHYNTNQALSKWNTISSTNTITANAGRYSTKGMVSTGGNASWMSKSFETRASWIVGFAVKFSSLPASFQTMFFQALDATNTVQLTLSITNTGVLNLYRSTTAGTLLGTSSVGVAMDTFYFLEFKFTISSSISANTCIVRLNGANVINLSAGTSTQQNLSTVAAFRIGSDNNNSNGTVTFEDFYICDTVGSNNIDFLGDCRIECLYPNGNGNSSQFVGSDADSTNNYQLVDETVPNSGTDYVQSSGVGFLDTYTMTDLSLTPSSIKGVQVGGFMKKSDAGHRWIAAMIRTGGSENYSTSGVLSLDYSYSLAPFDINPNSAAAFTQSDINNMETGFKILS
jgi:hypothetical protein